MKHAVAAAVLVVTFLPVAAARAGEARPKAEGLRAVGSAGGDAGPPRGRGTCGRREEDLAEAPARLQEALRTGRFEQRDVALITRWVLQAKEETVARGIADALRSADLSVDGAEGERWNPALAAMAALFDSALRDAAAHRRRDTKDWPELTALIGAAAPAIAASLREADPAARAELQRLLAAVAEAAREAERKR